MTKNKPLIPKLLEITRIILGLTGFMIAYKVSSKEALSWLLALLIIPTMGLTGLESLLFSKTAALMKGRESGSRYQIQSGFNNLAIAITGILVLLVRFGVQAQVTIILVALIFLALSSLNHAWEYFVEKKSLIHFQRLVFTTILWGATLPLIVAALG